LVWFYAGSWLGKLSDKIGFYKIMVFCLFTSGLLFFAIQYIRIWGLCIGMFVIMTIADMFRPAMFVSLGTYAKPKTVPSFNISAACGYWVYCRTRFRRFDYMNLGYSGLFWVDGSSCIISILILHYR
jgi:hypothetical protein